MALGSLIEVVSIPGRFSQQCPGDDSIKDTLACRDIADYFIQNLLLDYIYGTRYGQMWRSDVLDLDKPMKDGSYDPGVRLQGRLGQA
ncbi:hypothetical protein N7449_005592 [Penicillium cf. viridicatum]|uniref:Uncharacterized protein n=1 Tax=Penicillium cf. viridicatum TaxID=2972119 RepID=A0A9W9MLE1_9EURO|nr:hypothetical protein N7449_005592 [Penicillium cf. viridicatum]